MSIKIIRKTWIDNNSQLFSPHCRRLVYELMVVYLRCVINNHMAMLTIFSFLWASNWFPDEPGKIAHRQVNEEVICCIIDRPFGYLIIVINFLNSQPNSSLQRLPFNHLWRFILSRLETDIFIIRAWNIHLTYKNNIMIFFFIILLFVSIFSWLE